MPRKSDADRHRLVETSCGGCGTRIKRRPRDLKRYGVAYCSHSCHMRTKNAAGLTVNTSAAELRIAEQMRDAFPTICIAVNDRTLLPDGLEIDIHVPALKLAIELNGPIHSRPIFGNRTFAKTQANDRRKARMLKDAGYRLLTVDVRGTEAVTPERRSTYFDGLFATKVRPVVEELVADA